MAEQQQTEEQRLSFAYTALKAKITRELRAIKKAYDIKEINDSKKPSGVIFRKFKAYFFEGETSNVPDPKSFEPAIVPKKVDVEIDPLVAQEGLRSILTWKEKDKEVEPSDGWWSGGVHQLVIDLRQVLTNLDEVKNLTTMEYAYKQEIKKAAEAEKVRLEAMQQATAKTSQDQNDKQKSSAQAVAPAAQVTPDQVAALTEALQGLRSTVSGMEKQLKKVERGNEIVGKFLVTAFEHAAMKRAAIESNLGANITPEQIEYLPAPVVKAIMPAVSEKSSDKPSDPAVPGSSNEISTVIVAPAPISQNPYVGQGVAKAAKVTASTDAIGKFNTFILPLYTADGSIVAGQEHAFAEKGKLCNEALSFWHENAGNAEMQNQALKLIRYLLMFKNARSISQIKEKLTGSLCPQIVQLFGKVKDDADIVAKVGREGLVMAEALGMYKLFPKTQDEQTYFPYDPETKGLLERCYKNSQDWEVCTKPLNAISSNSNVDVPVQTNPAAYY